MLVYAEPADLVDGDWLASEPTNAVALIRAASQLVRSATAMDMYYTDIDGLPTDSVIAEVFRDATCAQAALWSLNGIDPSKGSLGRTLTIASQSSDGGSVSYSDAPTAAETKAAADDLCEASMLILKNAGLASVRPFLW